jgi:hypothetical protein
MMGSSAGRDVRQTFDYPKVPGLALGDAAVASRVECLSHSDFIARNCAVGAQQRGLLPCRPSLARHPAVLENRLRMGCSHGLDRCIKRSVDSPRKNQIQIWLPNNGHPVFGNGRVSCHNRALRKCLDQIFQSHGRFRLMA